MQDNSVMSSQDYKKKIQTAGDAAAEAREQYLQYHKYSQQALKTVSQKKKIIQTNVEVVAPTSVVQSPSQINNNNNNMDTKKPAPASNISGSFLLSSGSETD